MVEMGLTDVNGSWVGTLSMPKSLVFILFEAYHPGHLETAGCRTHIAQIFIKT